MVNAASLTILYFYNSFAVNVNVMQSNFISNQGVAAAGILIKHYNSALKSQTRIVNSTFKKNINSKKYKTMKTKETALGQTFCFIFTSAMTLYSTKMISVFHYLFPKLSFLITIFLTRYYQSIIYMNISNPSRLINVTFFIMKFTLNQSVGKEEDHVCMQCQMSLLIMFKL